MSEPDFRSIYETMATITLAESETVGAVKAGRLNAAVYPVRGLEGVCAALGDRLEPTDYLVSTYRNLGDAVSKGADLSRVVAESYGRTLGTSKGKGGPMHLVDVRAGFMATSGIVGGGVPIAVGLALAAQLDDEGQVCATTFGDGATSIGAFHEAMNLAAVWRLPIVFVCQNNAWGEHTSLAEYAGNTDLAQRAAAYGMRAESVDGFEVAETWQALRAAVDHARSGAGPAFVEAKTYRLGPHSAASDRGYMPKDEFAAAMERDPTPAFRRQMLERGDATEADLAEIDARVRTYVKESMARAVAAAEQSDDELYTDVFADSSAIPTSTKWKAYA